MQVAALRAAKRTIPPPCAMAAGFRITRDPSLE
jgi:hypothetical protein